MKYIWYLPYPHTQGIRVEIIISQDNSQRISPCGDNKSLIDGYFCKDGKHLYR